jgi:hypothetical protein
MDEVFWSMDVVKVLPEVAHEHFNFFVINAKFFHHWCETESELKDVFMGWSCSSSILEIRHEFHGSFLDHHDETWKSVEHFLVQSVGWETSWHTSWSVVVIVISVILALEHMLHFCEDMEEVVDILGFHQTISYHF